MGFLPDLMFYCHFNDPKIGSLITPNQTLTAAQRYYEMVQHLQTTREIIQRSLLLVEEQRRELSETSTAKRIPNFDQPAPSNSEAHTHLDSHSVMQVHDQVVIRHL